MMKENLFKKRNGEKIEDITQYILDYIKENKNGYSNLELSVGCDSFTRRKSINYAITLVFYDKMKHNGAHYVYKTFRIPKSYLRKNKKVSQWHYEQIEEFKYSQSHNVSLDSLIITRLWNEVEYLMELGVWLDEQLKGKYFIDHDKNEYDGSKPYRLPIIHVDFNPVDSNKNKSNRLYASAMGMLSGMGFKVVAKPGSYASSSAADMLCK